MVTAVISLSVAMLLPAVQSAKSAARRANCSNNLKQIGLATLNYSAAWGTLPPALILGEGHGNGHSAFMCILPFGEQVAAQPPVDTTSTSRTGTWPTIRSSVPQ